MVDATPNPAGTPPANDPAPGGQPQPAPTPEAQPGKGNEFILTQEQFNARWAEKHSEIEKDLGMPLKDVKAFIEANKKQPKPAPTGDTLTGADLKIARMEALMTAGVPSKQIPLLLQHLNIAGKTREEIQASIGQLIELKLLTIETTPAPRPGNQQDGTPNAAQGAGNPGVSGTPGKKTWKISEIARMSYDDHIKNQDEILKAMSEGRVIEG
jgi:DNA-binding transcriptional MerR regulator